MDRTVLDRAKNIHRQAAEMLYEGKCTVYERCGVTDPDTKITEFKEVPVYEGKDCRLSFEKTGPTYKQEEGYKGEQLIKLFLPPEMTVEPGCRIVVTQSGITGTYQSSGIPAVYPGHQEIVLKAWEGWV